MKFIGCGTALVTPFQRDGSLDEPRLRSLVRRQIKAGIDFLVPCGTTGESPTLAHLEYLHVIAITLEEAKGKVPVLAGCGGNNTADVIELGRELQALGVDGILSVTPYYNKPTQNGLYDHYYSIARALNLPIVVYNVPGRTSVNVEPATLARLAAVENIVGVKEASGNMAQIARVIHDAPSSFAVLSGDDALTLPIMSLGGRGAISVVSNEIPEEITALVKACARGDFKVARQLQHRYLPLMEVNFVETNPVPVKAALAEMGLLKPVWRLPLVPPCEASLNRICRVLRESGLINKHS